MPDNKKIDFDIAGARKAGATDSDISEYFKSNYSVDFDVAGARQAGATDDDILGYINSSYGQKKSQGESSDNPVVSLSASELQSEPPALPSEKSGTSEPIELPTSYQSDRSNYKDLVSGQKYKLLRGGKPVTGTWDSESQQFIKDPLISVLPKEKKSEGIIEKALRVSPGLTSGMGVPATKTGYDKIQKAFETEEEAFGRASLEADETEKEAAKKIDNLEYLSRFSQIRRLAELEDMLNVSDTKSQGRIRQEIDRIRNQPIDFNQFEGIAIDAGEQKVYQGILPKPGYEVVSDYSPVMQKKDATVGELYDEAKGDSEYVEQARQEIQSFKNAVNEALISKLPEDQKREIESLKGTPQYDMALEDALVKTKQIDNVAIAFLYGIGKKIEGITKLGEHLGLTDEEIIRLNIINRKKRMLFDKQPVGTAAELAASFGGMMPDVAAGAAYSPLMLVSMLSTMPGELTEQSIWEDYEAGREIDLAKARGYSAVSTASQIPLLLGAGKLATHGLKVIGKTGLQQIADLSMQVAKRSTADALLFGVLGTKIQSKINEAYDMTENDDYLNSMLHMAVIGGAFALIHGVPQLKIPKSKKNQIDYMASYLPTVYTRAEVKRMVDNGLMTPQDGDALSLKLDEYRTIRAQMPVQDLTLEQMEKIHPLWQEVQEINRMTKDASEEFKMVLKGQAKQLEQKMLIEAAVPLTAEERAERKTLTEKRAKATPIDEQRLKYLDARNESAKKSIEMAKAKAIAEEYGYSHPQHLLNEIKRQELGEFEIVQDVPVEILQKVNKKQPLPETEGVTKTQEDAIQIGKTEEVLQRQPEKDDSAGRGRESLEQREQGEEIAAEGQEIVADPLKDVESTTKALEGKIEKLPNVFNESNAKDVFYHSTKSKPFTKFDESLKGTNTEYPNTGQGFFFASKEGLVNLKEQNPDAFGDTELPVRLNIKNPINLTLQEIFNNKKQAKTIVEFLFKEELTENEALEKINDEIGLGELSELNESLSSKEFSDFVRDKGYDGIIGDMGEGNLEYIVFDLEKIQILTPKAISEAYHKAKADGSNPELVKAVEELLGKPVEAKVEEIAEEAKKDSGLEGVVVDLIGTEIEMVDEPESKNRLPIKNKNVNELKERVTARSRNRIDEAKKSIQKNGFTKPIIIDSNNNIIDGNHRYIAAKELGIEAIPTINGEGIAGSKSEIAALNKAIAESLAKPSSKPKVTEQEITIFKGQMGKLNADGTRRTAHPNAEGFFASESEETAKRYSGEDKPQKVVLPKGVTVEEVEVADKNKPMSEIRREEERLINESKAQIVKLKTIDAQGEEVQYIVKDKSLLGEKPVESKAEEKVEPTQAEQVFTDLLSKKRGLAERDKILEEGFGEQAEKAKFVFKNFKNIIRDMEKKGLLKLEGDCF